MPCYMHLALHSLAPGYDSSDGMAEDFTVHSLAPGYDSSDGMVEDITIKSGSRLVPRRGLNSEWGALYRPGGLSIEHECTFQVGAGSRHMRYVCAIIGFHWRNLRTG